MRELALPFTFGPSIDAASARYAVTNFALAAPWMALAPTPLLVYFNWLNRGVVWGTVMDQVSSASRLVFLDGRAKGVKADSTGSMDV